MPNVLLHQSARPPRPELAAARDFFWSAPDEALLDRRTVAAGLNRSVSWLEALATRGGGPEYLKVGRHRVLYRKRTVLQWFQRYSRAVSSTSEVTP